MATSEPELGTSYDPISNNEAHFQQVSTWEYIATRLPTLKPRVDKTANPFKLLATLNSQQWQFFAVAFFAWTWDAFDFFTVSLTVGDLAETFGKTNADITWGITLVLMVRSIGSTIFGIAADLYGRKWYAVLEHLIWQ
jgi:SHS family lactate transporter-like MFS transporter